VSRNVASYSNFLHRESPTHSFLCSIFEGHYLLQEHQSINSDSKKQNAIVWLCSLFKNTRTVDEWDISMNLPGMSSSEVIQATVFQHSIFIAFVCLNSWGILSSSELSHEINVTAFLKLLSRGIATPSMQQNPWEARILSFVNEFPMFYGTCRFITSFTIFHCKTSFQIRLTQSTPSNPNNLRPISVLYCIYIYTLVSQVACFLQIFWLKYVNFHLILYFSSLIFYCTAFTDKVERNYHFPAPGRNCTTHR
jgi:hypothetical protein